MLDILNQLPEETRKQAINALFAELLEKSRRGLMAERLADVEAYVCDDSLFFDMDIVTEQLTDTYCDDVVISAHPIKKGTFEGWEMEDGAAGHFGHFTDADTGERYLVERSMVARRPIVSRRLATA